MSNDADADRLISLRRRRVSREIGLRFKALVLRRLESGPGWKGRDAELRKELLSQSFLGLGNVMRGGRLDEFKMLTTRVAEAQTLGLDRRRDIEPLLVGVVGAVDTAIKQRENLTELRADCANALREFADGAKTFVCSDVHLGLKTSEGEAFEDVVDIRTRGDTLVLLGDILDFWIDDADAHDVIVANWKDLYDRLLRARDRGVRVIYTPGNHDTFVFILETAGHFLWSGTVLRRSEKLTRIRDAVADYPLVAAADIIYPFLTLPYGSASVLLTHGHAHEWEWRLSGGSPEFPGSVMAFVTGLTSVLAHTYAPRLRAAFNLTDAVIDSVKHVQDVAVEITNVHLEAYQVAELRTLRGKTRFADELERAFKELCTPDTRHRQALAERRALARVMEYREKSDLSDVRRAVENFLSARPTASTFCLQARDDFPPEFVSTPVGNLRGFDDFVCGHFHKPRDESRNHDSGCFFDGTKTYLQVNMDRAILRPPPA